MELSDLLALCIYNPLCNSVIDERASEAAGRVVSPSVCIQRLLFPNASLLVVV